jgi:hypothetical protein
MEPLYPALLYEFIRICLGSSSPQMESQLPYIPRVANEAAVNRWAERGKQGGNMSVTMLQSAEVEETAVQKLWRAVIASTVEEWANGPLRKKREAEQFLFSDNHDYRTVCYSAGINPENLRGRLEKIRSRQVAEAQAIASRN